MHPDPRPWQTKLDQTFYTVTEATLASGGKPACRCSACVGAGKTMAMVRTIYSLSMGELAEICPVDFHVIVAPTRGIVGSFGNNGQEAYGIIGALLAHDIWPLERITADDRLPGLMQFPTFSQNDGIITGLVLACTYQYLSQQRVIDTLLDWARQGKRLGMHYDEIHHVPKDYTVWANVVEQLNAVSVFRSSWSGTWFRTDQRPIKDQLVEGYGEVDYVYAYEDGLRDGHVRPVSFWIPDTKATTIEKGTGLILDERPVLEYLEDLPHEIKRALLDPDGWFVGQMIGRAEEELRARRTRYPNAGCLVICPPGFHEDSETGLREEDRIAERIRDRIKKETGKRVRLILNRDPVSHIGAYRDNNEEYLVAVNRISEGCDIPRLRILLILRDVKSELLFTQLIGRVIRRQPDDGTEPALVIIPPIHLMCEYARQVMIASQRAKPKDLIPCPVCHMSPCVCPCKRCGKRRPCPCPCGLCGVKPCICRRKIELDYFASLEGIHDGHIHLGSDIMEDYVQRATALRTTYAECSHIDIGQVGWFFQKDAELRGDHAGTGAADEPMYSERVIDQAFYYAKLRDQVEAKVNIFAGRYFKSHENKYKAAWIHLSHKFFPGKKWRIIKKDPASLSLATLQDIHAYLDRMREQI